MCLRAGDGRDVFLFCGAHDTRIETGAGDEHGPGFDTCMDLPGVEYRAVLITAGFCILLPKAGHDVQSSGGMVMVIST